MQICMVTAGAAGAPTTARTSRGLHGLRGRVPLSATLPGLQPKEWVGLRPGGQGHLISTRCPSSATVAVRSLMGLLCPDPWLLPTVRSRP